MANFVILTLVVVTYFDFGFSVPQQRFGHIQPPPNGTRTQQLHPLIHKAFAPNNSPFESSISSGLCDTEVPTASLISPSRPGYIPQSNGTRPGYSKIQVCCEGYKPKPHRFRVCEAICNPGCENSNCTAPNVCTCYPGYILDHNGNCAPKCPIGCANGYCKTPTSKECICKQGFKLDILGEQCIPECVHGCGNGRCVAPNLCECNSGYRRNEAGSCTQYCEGGCGQNEECVGPNSCQCRIGYTKNEQKQCVAHCDKPCQPGTTCTSPNKCTCVDSRGASCESSCSRNCLNGLCIGRDVCRCNEGYIQEQTSWYKCVAHCPRGCVNGVCSSPGLCICNPGYMKTSSVNGNICVPRN